MRKDEAEGDEALRRTLRTAEPELRSSGTFGVRAKEPSTSEQADLQPRVLVVLPASTGRLELVQALSGNGMHVVEHEPPRVDWSESLPPEEVDIAVFHASCLNLACAALALDSRFGFPELVFAVEDRCPAQRMALLSHGYRHVISAARLATWLLEQVASLCMLARARRIVLGACPATVASSDLTLGNAAGGGMNLHVAETHFRETYLRALLAEHGSRRRAADAAGVPYRSFCEMLRKLGI